MRTLMLVARDEGYFPSEEKQKTGNFYSVMLCSAKGKYRYLDAGPTENGIISIVITASYPPILGDGPCGKGN